MKRYAFDRVENGKKLTLAATPIEAETPEEAVAKLIETARSIRGFRWKDDGKWIAREILP